MNELFVRLAEQIATRPDGIVLQGADTTMTVSELDCAVHAFAATLQTHGITRLGLLAENSPGWIVADLACQCADVCLVPLPHYFSDTQIRHGIDRAGVEALITNDPGRVARVARCRPATFDGGEMYGLSLQQLAKPRRPALPDGTRKVTFTSGTTGAPRGVCLDTTHQLRVAQAIVTALGMTAPRHLCLLPLSTLLENVGGVYAALLAGGTAIAVPGEDTGLYGSADLDIRKLLQAIDRHQPTSVILLPQMLVALVAALEDGWVPPASLTFAAVGGGKVAPELVRMARNAGLPVYEGYGLSETASVTCLNRPERDAPGSVGQPLEHVDLRVERDEIVVRDNTFLGYADDPTSWYPTCVATGDIGHIDEQGFLYVSGRKKNQLISSYGRNISPEWIESELLANPILAQCFVFGEAKPWCVALVAPIDPACPDSDIQAWIDHVNFGLPDYARVRTWHRLSEPLTAGDGLVTDNGRPRRALIERRHAEVIDTLYAVQAAVTAV